MKKAVTVVLLCGLVACASRKSLRSLEEAHAQVRELQSQIEKATTQPGLDTTVLLAQLEHAIKRRGDARAKVESEKAESFNSFTETAETVAETAAPLANGLFPGVGALLVAVAGIIKLFSKKKEA